MIFKSISKDIKEIEDKEENLRKQISKLSSPYRKNYYRELEGKLKDPDTYAVINWVMYFGGFHNLYLGLYKTFFIEFSIAFICYSLLILGLEIAIIPLICMYIYELPALFFSQKIVRYKNYQISKELFMIEKKKDPDFDSNNNDINLNIEKETTIENI